MRRPRPQGAVAVSAFWAKVVAALGAAAAAAALADDAGAPRATATQHARHLRYIVTGAPMGQAACAGLGSAQLEMCPDNRQGRPADPETGSLAHRAPTI